MSLSDDVASLKVGVHKLAVAIEELSIRKYLQGEIDISKLPWFTPQYVPGDSIKLPGSRLPTTTTTTVYPDRNEVIASPTPGFLNTSDNSLGAHQVFDKIPEPISRLNQVQIVQVDPVCIKTPLVDHPTPCCHTYAHAKIGELTVSDEDGNSHKGVDDDHEKTFECISTSQILSTEVLLSTAHNLFAKMSDPMTIFSEVLMSTNEDVGTRSDKGRVMKAHNLFDGIPNLEIEFKLVPMTFTHENTWMQTLIQVVCKSFSPLFEVDNVDTFSWVWKLIDFKGPALNTSLGLICSRVFVFDPGASFLHINEIEIGPCAKLFGLISGCKAHVNYKELHSWDKYRSYTQFALLDRIKKASYFRGDVTKQPTLKLCKCSNMLISTHSSSCIFMILVNGKYVGVLECDIHPNTAWIFVTFDPGTLEAGVPKLFFTTTLEDKGVFRGEEGISREQTWLLLNPLVLWSNYNAGRMRKSVVFLTRVFDPGGLWDVLTHSSWCSNPNLGFCTSCLMVCVLDELGNCNTWLPLLSNMSCSRIITMINAFSPGHISVRIALLLNGSSFHLLKENLKVATKCFMKKEVVRLVTIFIFYPGINKPRLVEKRSVAVRCSVGVTSNLVFVYAEILVWPKRYSLRQGYEAARWKLLGRVVFVIEKRAYAIEETREKNSARKDPTISSKFSMFMIINTLVFDPGGWTYNISLAESATSKFLQTTEIFLSCYLAQLDLLHSSNCADHEVAILVFDPGGYGNGQKVKKQPEACQYGGGKRLKDKRNEDHWIYVFDPGGY